MPKPEIFEFDAIGTHWWCESLAAPISATLSDAWVATARQFDQDYSRFIESSLVSTLNRSKSLTNPPHELITMLELARELFEVSDGAFDISVGGTLHAQGYGSRRYAASVVPDFWDHTIITHDRIEIPHDAVIDLGGLGKGWLIDRLAQLAEQYGLTKYIINGGGDMYIAAPAPIPIALEDPAHPDTFLTSIEVLGGFAASSQAKRQWQDGTATKAHIVDPRTNDTAVSPIQGSFVQAPTATIADAMATILLLRPDLRQSLTWRYDLKVMLV